MGAFNEQDFLRNYRHIPQRAFRQLMDEYRDRVFAFCRRAASRREDAEDLAQEVFIRTWKGLDNFRGESGLTTWIYRIAWNVCASFLEKKGHSIEIAVYEENIDDEADALAYAGAEEDAQYASFEARQQLKVLFERLPAAHKLMLTMYYLQEMTYEEIGAATGRPLGSVKATLHRAKESLRTAALAEMSSR
jgi:RNA polymerase sigma-70 factor (ECF subfamily)